MVFSDFCMMVGSLVSHFKKYKGIGSYSYETCDVKKYSLKGSGH